MTGNAQRRGVRGGRESRGFGLVVRGLAAWACILVAAAAAGEAWMTDFDAAMEAAREQEKPVLTVFTGSDW